MRKTRKIIFCLLAMVLLFSVGCGKTEQEKQQEGTYQIYYSDINGNQLMAWSYKPQGKTTDELIVELEEVWNTPPTDVNYVSAKPAEIHMPTDNLLSDDGQLTIFFDSTYQSLSNLYEVMMRASLVRTLIQIPEINYIEFYVNEEPLMRADGSVVGYMDAETFIDNTEGETNYYQSTVISLYFADASGEKLKETSIHLEYDGTLSLENLIVEQLIKGPEAIQGLDTKEYYPVLPKNLKINKVTTSDGICYVDMEEAFLTKIPEVSEEVALYSVVDSLIELPYVNQVQFRIDGDSQKFFSGIISLNQLFDRNYDLMEGE